MYSGPRNPVLLADERCTPHNPVSPKPAVQEQRLEHCNRRRWVDSAEMLSEPLSEVPAQESDCTHDAGPDLS